MANKNDGKNKPLDDPRNDKTYDQPLAIMHIFRMLYEFTDEQHGLTSGEISERLAALRISLKPVTVRRYIDLLADMGSSGSFEIECPGQGGRGGYRMVSREFDISEVKLLADAVAGAKFIPEKEASSLLKKLRTLVSAEQGKLLNRTVFINGRPRTSNRDIVDIKNNVDWIHYAISEHTQLEFRYYQFNVKKELVPRGETRICTPYALVWSEDRYYLVASHPAYGIANYRVDHMKKLTIPTDKKGRPLSAERIPKNYIQANGDGSKFDIPKYLRSTFSMFGGNTVEQVKLWFDSSLVGTVLDKFGHENTFIVPDDDEKGFTVTVEVRTDAPEPFFGWLFGFGKKTKVVAPEHLKDKYCEMLRQVLDNQE